MTYSFTITQHKKYTQVEVYRDSVDKVFELWLCQHDSGDIEVHLPVFKSKLSIRQTRFLWRYLAGQLPFRRYRAYIKGKPIIQRLAKHCGFIDQGDFYLWAAKQDDQHPQ